VAIERAKNGKKTCYLHDVGMFRGSRNGAIHITLRRPKNAAFRCFFACGTKASRMTPRAKPGPNRSTIQNVTTRGGD